MIKRHVFLIFIHLHKSDEETVCLKLSKTLEHGPIIECALHPWGLILLWVMWIAFRHVWNREAWLMSPPLLSCRRCGRMNGSSSRNLTLIKFLLSSALASVRVHWFPREKGTIRCSSRRRQIIICRIVILKELILIPGTCGNSSHVVSRLRAGFMILVIVPFHRETGFFVPNLVCSSQNTGRQKTVWESKDFLTSRRDI